MSQVLIVTTFCRGDLPLVKKRLEWMVELGQKPTHDLLLVDNANLSDQELAVLAKDHQKVFKGVHVRKILQPCLKNEWPDTVNYAWRRTLRIVHGQYGEKFDAMAYRGWFYFEPDVTPLAGDWATQIESAFLAGKRPYCGRINTTETSDGKSIFHLNGAAVYPLGLKHYDPKALQVDGVPWDVAGLGHFAISRASALNDGQYAHAFGTKDYRKEGNRLVATQTLMNGESREVSSELTTQFIHHGCKDGSLIDCLSNFKRQNAKVEVMPNVRLDQPPADNVARKSNPSGQASPSKPIDIDPKFKKQLEEFKGETVKTPKDQIEEIKADHEAGMKWKELIKKYKISPAKLSKILHE